MARRSREQMEKDEKKVISLLQKDSRDSVNQMAEELGFSRQKVWRIIKRLEKNNDIWGYTAVVDDDKVDQKKFVMLIKRSMQPGKKWVDKITDLTMQKKGKKLGVDIEYSMFLNGEHDWLFILSAKGLKEVKKFGEKLSEEYEGIIKEVELLENVFTVEKRGVINPKIDELKEFF
ncbi:MAG: Lrp/AsnC family transcriptional regulator [Candidatus Thermoplasmatota archaeon]